MNNNYIIKNQKNINHKILIKLFINKVFYETKKTNEK
jgi:hypothetical protein